MRLGGGAAAEISGALIVVGRGRRRETDGNETRRGRSEWDISLGVYCGEYGGDADWDAGGRNELLGVLGEMETDMFVNESWWRRVAVEERSSLQSPLPSPLILEV